jgi:hypothetical protein
MPTGCDIYRPPLDYSISREKTWAKRQIAIGRVNISMGITLSDEDLGIIGHRPFKSTLTKPKKRKSKKPRHPKFGETYDPAPKNLGQQYNPMAAYEGNAFALCVLRLLSEKGGSVDNNAGYR